MSILICYDGSESAKHAVSATAQLLPATPVLLVTAWAPPPSALPDSFGQEADELHGDDDPLIVQARERAREIAEQGRDLALELGLPADAKTVRADSSYWQALLDTAQGNEAELMVLGTRGHHAAESHLLGSVANSVAHHSQIPVMVVPTP